MSTIQDLLQVFLSPSGRLQGAVCLFLVIWALKSIPALQRWALTSDRARLLATLIAAFLPASVMLADPTVEAKEAWLSFLTILLGAMGLQGGAKAVLGQQLKARIGIGAPSPQQQPPTEPQRDP